MIQISPYERNMPDLQSQESGDFVQGVHNSCILLQEAINNFKYVKNNIFKQQEYQFYS